MATAADYILLRQDTGLTILTLTDVQAAAIYEQVTLLYPTGSAATIYAAARVTVLRQQLASYATQVSYTQNQESVDQSDAFKNMMQLLGYWERALADAIGAEATGTGITPPASGTVRLRAVF